MERITALIDKLHSQKEQQASPAQLLMTVQMLQSELLKLQQRNGSLGTAKVAVTLPSFIQTSFEEETSLENISSAAPSEMKVASIVAEESKQPEHGHRLLDQQEIRPQPRDFQPLPPQHQEYLPKEEAKAVQPPDTPHTLIKPQTLFNPAFREMDEVPTLQQNLRREVNDVMGEKKESLNERLREEKSEVAHRLKDAPIRDLRKAIGINDRFSFVSELFRGDDAMYERSIKTINDFHVLAEAEYWMNRELKVKLGWNDSKELVQHFYQLVRRRFS